MEKLLIIQPFLTPYRVEVYRELADTYEVYLLCAPTNAKAGFGQRESGEGWLRERIEVRDTELLGGRLGWQHGIVSAIRRIKPDRILFCANIRYLSYWWALLYTRLAGYTVYSHHQGPYDKPRSLTYRMLYGLMAALSHKVILYTPYSLGTVRELGLKSDKFTVAANSIVNHYPVLPGEKDPAARGVLFVGRLRDGCNLELLLDAVEALRGTVPGIVCHVVGGGELEQHYRTLYASCEGVVFHGAVYDQAQIREISRGCAAGCYPGDAGLSVVHYMSLSLACVVHDRMDRHMGPEPTYVADGVNGRLFRYGDGDSLREVLRQTLDDKDRMTLGAGAYETYLSLTHPSYAARMAAIMKD